MEKKYDFLVIGSGLGGLSFALKAAEHGKVCLISKSELAKTAENGFSENYDLVITSYGTLMKQDWLLEADWNLAILDEAQAIKNPNSRQTKQVKHIKARSRIALTGTPIENRLSDLWSLFDFICPGLLGKTSKFKQFIKSLESRNTQQYAPLRNLVSPYILRRLKTDKTIISDLPDKTEVQSYCQLTKKQAVIYQKTVKQLAKTLKKSKDYISKLPISSELVIISDSNSTILELVMPPRLLIIDMILMLIHAREINKKLNEHFKEQLKTKRLVFTIINTDQPENKHFVEEYQLYTRSLIIAEFKDGKQVRWKNLTKVWNYLNDRDKFYKYVQSEIQKYLENI